MFYAFILTYRQLYLCRKTGAYIIRGSYYKFRPFFRRFDESEANIGSLGVLKANVQMFLDTYCCGDESNGHGVGPRNCADGG